VMGTLGGQCRLRTLSALRVASGHWRLQGNCQKQQGGRPEACVRCVPRIGVNLPQEEVCEQLVDQHRVAIHLTADPLPESLSEQVSLCFYRVAQEALMNAVKHSGTSQVDVSLDFNGNFCACASETMESGLILRSEERGWGWLPCTSD
jgi:hypothetical protein